MMYIQGGIIAALDKFAIGLRIREIREEVYKETRSDFSYRCSITESHLGQIERGEILVSLNALDKIAIATGSNTDYLLYGKLDNKDNKMRKHINKFLDRSNDEELKAYFKCLTSIKECVDIKNRGKK